MGQNACYELARRTLGPVSISEKTSFRKISLSLEAARFVFRIVRSLWNLTGTSAAVLPMCLSNFKAIRQFKVPISWLRDFTRSYEKTSFRILRRGPASVHYAVKMKGFKRQFFFTFCHFCECSLISCTPFTHGGGNKIATILQTSFPNWFRCIQIAVLLSKFR